MKSRKPELIFYYKEKYYKPGEFVVRSYRDIGNILFRLLDLLQYSGDIAEVYLKKTISPAFREKIMLTSAIANNCHM